MGAKSIGLAAASTLLFFNVSALAAPKPVIDELFKSNQTLGGRSVVYPEGKPEMRVYKVTLAPDSTIPLHTHPSPVVAFVQEGALHNVRVVDGAEVVDLIVAGEGFLEGSPDEPHYVVNKGTTPAVVMVTFASVEGMPNLVAID